MRSAPALAILLAGLALAAAPALAQLPGEPGGNFLDGTTGADAVDGNQAFRTWIDKPVRFQARDGTSGTMLFGSDGGATQVGDVADVVVDKGKWRHHELGFCTTWQKTANGQERCYSIGTTGGDTLVTLQGGDGPSYYVKP